MPSRLAASVLAAAATLAVALPARARGAAPRAVTLDVDPCAGVPTPFIERVVAAELAGEAGSDAEPPLTAVRVTCRAGLLVVVTATTGSSEPSVREIDLGHEDPQARPRVLSVAIAELVSASRARPPPPKPAAPPPPPPPVAAPSPSPAPAPPPLRAREWSVGLDATARGFSSLTLLGAGLWGSYLSR
ncbi:MAG TPA: hypothetical protein VGI39_32195, partial [Polyangiaceae bacterium]